MARLGVYRDSFRDFLKLEKTVQDQVIAVFAKFEEATYAGLHLETVNNAREARDAHDPHHALLAESRAGSE
ncbi:hypothetical protein ACWDR9_09990 [Streptosporangium sandarakinum]